MPASICAHTQTCMYTHTQVHTHTYPHQRQETQVCTHTHTHTLTHMSTWGIQNYCTSAASMAAKSREGSEMRRSKIRWRNVNLPSLASGHCRRMAGHEWERKMSQYAILLLLHSPSLNTVTICGGLASTKNIRQRGWRETHTETLKTALR